VALGWGHRTDKTHQVTHECENRNTHHIVQVLVNEMKGKTRLLPSLVFCCFFGKEKGERERERERERENKEREKKERGEREREREKRGFQVHFVV